MYMAKLKDYSKQKGETAKTVLQRSAEVFLKVAIDQVWIIFRDKSILLFFSPIFHSDNFFLPIMLKILLEVLIFCLKVKLYT